MLFNFTRTLEELDASDVPRLMRAVEAGNLEKTWGRYHDPSTKKTVADAKVVNELYAHLTDEQFERLTGRKRKR